MATLSLGVAVDAPVDRVFDYLLDPRRLWSVLNVAVADVVETPDGVGTTARIWSHFSGFHIEGGLEYTEVVRPRRVVIDIGFMVEHPARRGCSTRPAAVRRRGALNANAQGDSVPTAKGAQQGRDLGGAAGSGFDVVGAGRHRTQAREGQR